MQRIQLQSTYITIVLVTDLMPHFKENLSKNQEFLVLSGNYDGYELQGLAL